MVKQDVKKVIRKAPEIKKAPTYFPINERIAETPPPNFKPIDLDLFKGLGGFLVRTRKD